MIGTTAGCCKEEQMYIVTGGAGFIGSAMIWRMNQAGIDNILVVDHLASTEKWKNLVNLHYRDYQTRDDFLRAIREGNAPHNVQAVIHLGACSSTTERDADFLMANNVHYSQAVCRYALDLGARYIQASSAATYGDGSQGFSDSLSTMHRLRPLNMYGYSKQLFDLWAFREQLLPHIACLKFFNVYGPNEYHKGEMRSMICKAVPQILETGKLRLFRSDRPEYVDGGQLRDFVYVKDCVNVIWWLLRHPYVNGIFNVGTGNARSWNDLGRAVFSALQRPEQIEYIDMPASLKGKYQYYTQADMSWMERCHCQINFHSLEDGVHDYVQNYLLKPDPYLA